MWKSLYTYVCTCTYAAKVHACACKYVHAYVCTYVHTCVRAYICGSDTVHVSNNSLHCIYTRIQNELLSYMDPGKLEFKKGPFNRMQKSDETVQYGGVIAGPKYTNIM